MTETEVKLIDYLARDGKSLEEIRKTVGIGKCEWKRYLKENPGEKARLENLRRVTDYAVEDALLKRALGYTCEEHRESEKPNGTEAVTTIKDVPPDVRAATLWLKFRRAEVWDDKQDEEDADSISERIEELDKEAQNEDE